MVNLPVKTIRRETGLIEAVCRHGVGHPVFGSVDWMTKVTKQTAWEVHGCDGCCNHFEWELQTLRDSVRIANDHILDHKEEISRLEDEISDLHCTYDV